jgi:hypothetical protein
MLKEYSPMLYFKKEISNKLQLVIEKHYKPMNIIFRMLRDQKM